MGLEKKEWDHEQPVEQNLDALAAYRDEGPKEKGNPLLWILAWVCCGLSVYALYYMETKLYCYAINTNWASWLGILIGTSIGLKIAKAMGRENAYEKWDKKIKVAIFSVTAALLLLYLWLCRNRPHLWIVAMQLLVLLPVAYTAEYVLKKKMGRSAVNAWSYVLMYICIALTTFAAPKILGMTSVTEGEKLLRAEGYQGVYFETRAMAYWMGKEMETQVETNRPEELADEYVYLYGGAKDDKSYGILVDPYGQGILAVQEKLPGTVIYDWLD